MSRYFNRYRIAAPFGLLLALFLFAAAAAPADAAFHYSFVNTSSLAFGSLIAGSGGTVTIAPSNGARSKTGGVTLMSSTYQAASFTVSCVPDSPLGCLLVLTYSITPVTGITLTSGANSMSVGNFSADSANILGSPNITGSLVPSPDTLKVGATLTVGNNQAPGTYSGSFSVTISYP